MTFYEEYSLQQQPQSENAPNSWPRPQLRQSIFKNSCTEVFVKLYGAGNNINLATIF